MFSYTKPFTVPEQFKTVFPDQLQHQFQQQVALLQSLSGKAIEGAEKLLELNLHLGHDSIEHSRAVAQKLFASKSAQEFFSHSSDLFKPNLEQLLNYGRKLIHIATESQAQVLQAAVQKAAKSEKEFVKLVVEAEKKAEHLIDEVHHNARSAVKEVGTAIEAASGKKVDSKPGTSKKASQSAPAAKKVQPKAEQDKPAKATAKTTVAKNGNFPPQLPAAPQVKPAKPAAKAKSAATPAHPAVSKEAATPTADIKPAATVAAAIEPIASAVASNTEKVAEKTTTAANTTSNAIATEINTIE